MGKKLNLIGERFDRLLVVDAAPNRGAKTYWLCKCECGCCIYVDNKTCECHLIDKAPAVDAIPIDDVAEMLLDLFGDGCPCNYNDIDEMLSLDCAGDCPADGNPICWRKYVRVWKERKYRNDK